MRRRYIDHPRFNPLIESLYAAFSAKAPADRVGRWLDMPGPEFEAKCVGELSARRVWELSGDVYSHTAWHAMCWDAEHADTLMYFLPRMLDEALAFRVMPTCWAMDHLFNRDSHGSVDLEMIVAKLAQANWRQWPAKQQERVSEAFTSLWRWALEKESWGELDVLPLLLMLGFNVQDVLRQWLSGGGLAGALSVAHFVTFTQLDVLNLRIPAWRSYERQTLDHDVERQVILWLLSPEVSSRLEAAFFEATSAEDQHDLSLGVEVLSAMRNAVSMSTQTP